MKKNLLLIALVIAFTSDKIESAAALADNDLVSLQALANWPVTVEQLKAHHAYREESERKYLPNEDTFVIVDRRLQKHLQLRKLASAQANCDLLRKCQYPSASSLADEHQKTIDLMLQTRADRKAQLAGRLLLAHQCTHIRQSPEYATKLAQIQEKTKKAKNNDDFNPLHYYSSIHEQSEGYLDNTKFSEAQALIDFLATLKYDYPTVDELNDRQRSINIRVLLQKSPADFDSIDKELEEIGL